MSKSTKKDLTSERLLAKNTIYSLVGQGAPLVVIIFFIPILIKEIGTDRFGLLTLAWMVVSYLSLFDLGLGRALTQLVAENLGKGDDEKVPPLVWTASLLMLGLGTIGALIFALFSPYLVLNLLKIPSDLKEEALTSFFILSVSVPIVTCSAGFVGILSALQRFDFINIVRIPLGLSMILGPMAMLPLSKSLIGSISILLACRLIACVAYLYCCFLAMPSLRKKNEFKKELLIPLFKFGGWMTITNIIGPVMAYMDRFLIGGLISITAISYYTTPYEAVSKLWLIPGSLVSVLFPAFSTSFFQDKSYVKHLFDSGLKYIFLILFPIILFITTFAHEGLNMWLGEEFANNSDVVLKWLAVGIFLNSLSQVPYALIQGIGRPDITAKVHFFELPLYLLMLWFLTIHFGIVGTAFAWVVRVALDTLVLFIIGSKLVSKNVPILIISIYSAAFSLILLSFAIINVGVIEKSILLLLTISLFLTFGWLKILDNKERNLFRKLLRFA